MTPRNATDLAPFLQAISARLGEGRVLSPDRVRPLERSVEGLRGHLAAAVRPTSTEEVAALVQAAGRHGVPLYPVSCGRNWGYGTRLPPRDGAVLVDLSGMDRIRSLDLTNGVAEIEPGVTQRDLSRALLEAGDRFYTDVTGSGAQTSILGNTLERGVAYNSLRADNLRSLEVVLGDGRRLRTGMDGLGSRLEGLYRHGVGPGLTELFLQSNLGIVTAARVALRPVPEARLNFQIALADPARLAEFVAALADLKRDLGFGNILHIGDRARAMDTLAPLVRANARAAGLSLSRGQLAAALSRRLSCDWSGVGVLEGPAKLVRARRALLVGRLRGFGKVRFYRYETVARAASWARRLGLAREAAELEALRTIMGFTRGIPSDGALHSIYWPLEDHSDEPATPEAGRAGWILFTPLMPARGGDVVEALSEIDRITAAHEVRRAVTLNLLTDQVLEAVVSLCFPLDEPAAVDRARACSRALNRRFVDLGMTPYRVPVDQYDVLHDRGSAGWEVACRLKEALDPCGVIAPGRWLPSGAPQ
jgi:4-cresol dehydrogenase (hydroxylating)